MPPEPKPTDAHPDILMTNTPINAGVFGDGPDDKVAPKPPKGH